MSLWLLLGPRGDFWLKGMCENGSGCIVCLYLTGVLDGLVHLELDTEPVITAA